MTDYIVDASVVAKWLIREADSARARALINPEYFLRAPDLLMAELGNILWKRAARGDLSAGESGELLKEFLQNHIDVTVRLLPSRLVIKQALLIAAAERHSIYDCIYLALAVQARCVLITADDLLVKAVRGDMLKPHIISLGDLQ